MDDKCKVKEVVVMIAEISAAFKLYTSRSQITLCSSTGSKEMPSLEDIPLPKLNSDHHHVDFARYALPTCATLESHWHCSDPEQSTRVIQDPMGVRDPIALHYINLAIVILLHLGNDA